MRNPYVRLILILIVLGVVTFFAIRWVLSLPTPEEKIFINLVRDFEAGDYDAVSDYCVGGSFREILEKSKVYDTDGTEINWRTNVSFWSEAKVREAIEEYIKYNLGPVKFRSLATQKLNEGAQVIVHFLIDFKVYDRTAGNLLAPDVYDGAAEGDCRMVLVEGGKLLIEKIDFTLISTEGMNLRRYLGRL